MSGFEYLGILQDMKMDSLAAFRNPYELNISSSTTLGNGTMTDEQLRQFAPEFMLGPDGKLVPGAREALLSTLKKKSAASSASRPVIDPETGKPLQRNLDPNAVWYDPGTGLQYGSSPSARRPVSVPAPRTTVSPSVPTTKSGMSTKHVVGYGIGALVVGYALFKGYQALQDRR